MSLLRALLFLALVAAAGLPAQAQSSGPTGEGPHLVIVLQQGSRLKVAYPPYEVRLEPRSKAYRVTGPDFQWVLDPSGPDRYGAQSLTPPGRARAPEGRSGSFLDDVVAGIGVTLPAGETPVAVSKAPGGDATVTTSKTNADGSTSYTDHHYDSKGNEVGTTVTPPEDEGDV